jgi:hypothetical protein
VAGAGGADCACRLGVTASIRMPNRASESIIGVKNLRVMIFLHCVSSVVGEDKGLGTFVLHNGQTNSIISHQNLSKVIFITKINMTIETIREITAGIFR